MFDSRRFSSRIQSSFAALLLAASLAGPPAAKATTPAGEQWRAVGDVQPVSSTSPTPSSTNPDRRRLNQQSAAVAAQATQQVSNPLRQARHQQPIAAAREPRAFQAPASAAPLAKRQPTASTAPSAMTSAKQANAANWQLPNGRPNANSRPTPNYRAATQHDARSAAATHKSSNASSAKLWQTINVAFEGETEMSAQPENLPMLGPHGGMHGRMMHGPSGFDEFNEPFDDGPYHPYSGPGAGGAGGDGCACGADGCSCGDGCEPGCGCGCGDTCGCGDACAEPGCDCKEGECAPGCGCPACCNDDLFCIGPGDDESCHTVRLRWPKWQEVMVFGGVQGFKGPYDQDRDSGNFGFHEGFNIGAKIPYAQAGYQFGYRSTQNQLNGDKDTDIDEQHFQQFATAGLFRRTTDGIQGGVVWDLLNDERFHTFGYHQLRSELSVITEGTHEIGFTTIIGLNDREPDDDVFFQASDQFLLFYRYHGPKGGEGRFYVGGTDNSDGIVGSDLLLPLGDRFSLNAGFTYLIPDAESGEEGASEEAWNIGLGLVWHFHNQARKSHQNCYRPFFNVADNGTLIVREREDED